MNTRILLLSGSISLAKRIRKELARGKDSFAVECVSQPAAALARIKQNGIAAVVVEFEPPLTRGLHTLRELTSAAPAMPILVIGEDLADDMAEKMLEHGAQDYLIRTRLDHYTLVRAIRTAIGRKAADDALFFEKERAQVTLNSIGDAVISTDLSGKVTYLNGAAERMTGWSRAEASGLECAVVLNIIDGKTGEPAPNPFQQAMRERQTVTLKPDSILLHRDGTKVPIEDSAAPIRDRSGKLMGAVIVFHDVSESRALTQRMSYLAQHDCLTDLPNRVLLNDRLDQCIALSRRHKRRLAILFLDLDHFKYINDSLGHLIGDDLLKEVARRLLLCVRRSDTVSRQGGDEFVVLLSEVEHTEHAVSTAEKIRLAIAVPYFIASHQVDLSVSIGISLYPDDGENAETLIKSADIAMYHAKENGRNNSQFFENAMNVRTMERQSMEGALSHALGRREFVLHYQPKINLETGALTGTEALIRWRHPSRGLIYPAEFIGIAEETGLIASIGKWVLREACTQARAWLDAGLAFGQMAVNISAVEFSSRGFLDNVRQTLKETGLAPSCLEIEVTETAIMRNMAATCHVLDVLSALGVRIALDDFGTGYSSLSYLMRFPIDTLKIDKCFIQDIASNMDAATIIGAVISLGQTLNLQVVAEGVETAEQLSFLRTRGCTQGQGYYFSKPALADAYRKLLEIEVINWGHLCAPLEHEHT